MDYVSKFGAMYVEDENGEYELYSIFLADYNVLTDEYFIISGPCKNLDGELFNLITTDPDIFFNTPGEVEFKDYDEDKSQVLLFEDYYIDNVKSFFNFQTEEATYAYIANNLATVKIHKNKDGSFYTRTCETDKNYTEEDVIELLYEDGTIQKISDYSDEIEKKKFDSGADALRYALSSMMNGLDNSQIFSIGPIGIKQNNSGETIEDYLEKMKKRFAAEREKREESLKINTRKIIDTTSKKIVGQEQVIRTLVNQIFNNQMIINELEKQEELDYTELDARKASILLDGETGTGKTAIIKDICLQLGLPVSIAPATKYSATGYVGASLTDLLEDLLKQADGDIDLAERGIIVFDEVDKLAFKKDSVIGVDMKEDVQHELLSFIGGGEYDVPIGGGSLFSAKVKFNTSKITFILSGAFTDLREDKIKELEKSHNSVGFSGTKNEDYVKEYIVTPDDYIQYGLMREFFGRIKVLTSTKSYDIEDCKKILLESSVSPLIDIEKNVMMYGYSGITYDEEFLNKIAEEGLKMKTGARGLQTVLQGIKNNMLDDLINDGYEKGKPINLTTDLVDKYKKSFIRKV